MQDSVIILAAGGALAILAATFVLVLLRSERDGPKRPPNDPTGRHPPPGSPPNSRADRTLQQTQSGLNDRLDGLSKRLGEGLAEQTEKTGQTLKDLQSRLAVIDRAQQNITDLSQQVVGLQDILSNKQARGAFGEIQLQDIMTGALPPSAFALQVTLGNGARADCLLHLPNPPGAIAIDAKFPLESYQALREAKDEAALAQARRTFSADVMKHVRDIAEKYIIPGETAESALMFLPSEAVYAELHANFRNVIEDSFRRRVWIRLATTLMATLNTVRAVLKDARMREQAGVIQARCKKRWTTSGASTSGSAASTATSTRRSRTSARSASPPTR
jgi:DNA recombination protein RmuC